MFYCQIYRREEANRYAKENSSGSSIDAGQDKRQNSEGRFFCCGFPGVSQQEVQQANLPDSRDSGQDHNLREALSFFLSFFLFFLSFFLSKTNCHLTGVDSGGPSEFLPILCKNYFQF